ncbi:carbohydrate-binding module family 20 protein [Botryobasidium botryosum FD-172 SS1]|uniref:Glucoamylase n=1 Tax=Botryobasidium botryosum (strain FD-172 SS1) TaxID=930990 RepID=A0A067MYQ6_BOTB1|nr:carbohydrate-binding module family 20 protein [Botryobasidium botryosum FD-172 SS1]
MRFSAYLLLSLVPTVLGTSGGDLDDGLTRRQSSVDSFISTESPIAKAGILANIGPSGAKCQGAKSGVVIAGPSTGNPVDYAFTWTRDSALVYKVLIDQYIQGRDNSLLTGITNWVASGLRLQQVSNPSGTVSSGGLGEPKFNRDETPFTGGWGRPQRDGPALRAITTTAFANYLSKQGNTSYVTNTLWPFIRLDLDYVRDSWNLTGFDLWEEVNASSFFTTAVQHRALREGAKLAAAQGDAARSTAYTTQAGNVLCFLQSYWSSSQKYIISNINGGGGRSGLDANSILTSIHTFDPAAGCEAATFQPCSDVALANHFAVVNSFRGSLYPINSGIPAGSAVAIGRYKEDSYFGGNPWYLTTLATAEQLYDALYQWKKIGSITVTATSLQFFQQFSPSVAVGTYASTSSTYTTLTGAIKTYADGFVAIVQKYIGAGGALAEQFTRANGTPASAPDLTWSYAAALTAFDARAGVVPGSWGAAGLTAPAQCSTNNGGGGGGGGGNTVAITFQETATTVWGENIFLTGSIDALKNWSPNDALALSADSYPVWKITVNVPAGANFQYKFIRKFNGAVTWESDPNRSYTAPGSGSVTLNDSWR